MPYILALDEGTTSARALIFDEEGTIKSVAQKEFTQHFPRDGWVEHDPEEIWACQLAVAQQAIQASRSRAGAVAAIGITNQRETTIVWERSTGRPVYPAIVWQDRRTAPWCERLRAAGKRGAIPTAHRLAAGRLFFSEQDRLDSRQCVRAPVPKPRRANWRSARSIAGSFGSSPAEPSISPIVTNASRTLLFNIHTGQWDDDLLRLCNIPRHVLPEVHSSSEVYGDDRGGPRPACRADGRGGR